MGLVADLATGMDEPDSRVRHCRKWLMPLISSLAGSEVVDGGAHALGDYLHVWPAVAVGDSGWHVR